MEQTLGVLIGVGLVLVATRYALALRRTQLALETPAADETRAATVERETEMRQSRRRWQTAVMLALLGAALAIGVWIPPKRFPTFYVAFWFATVILACWIGFLALGDLFLVNRRVSRLVDKLHAERDALDREYRHARVAAETRQAARDEMDAPNALDLRPPRDSSPSSNGARDANRERDDSSGPSPN